MTLNGVMAVIFALFQRIFMYDVGVKQLLGLHRFQNLLLILYNHIKPICAIIQRLFGQTEVITGFLWVYVNRLLIICID